MSAYLTKEKQHYIFAHFSLDGDMVIDALSKLLCVMSFYNETDLRILYNIMKDCKFYEEFSILFENIGPFGTFQKFKVFFQNALRSGLLEFDLEEFSNGIVEFSWKILSNAQIKELISKIEITKCISLHEVFFLRFPTSGGSIDGASLYQCPRLKLFAGGHQKKDLRHMIEGELINCGVEIQKTPQMTLVFPEHWMKEHFSKFITQLVENIGFSEIEYVAESSSIDSFRKEIAQSDVQHSNVFNHLSVLFMSNNTIDLSFLNTAKFATVCGVPTENICAVKKEIFGLFVKFLFEIENGVAHPHPSFYEHVDHFVVAFMKLIGACLNGIVIQAVIKSGPKWVFSDKTPKVKVCASVAMMGQRCRKIEKCSFLHTETTDYGIITSHTGNLMVVCKKTQPFDKTPSKSEIFYPNFLKDGIISFESSDTVSHGGEFSAESETCAVAHGGSADPETRVVAGGGSAEPRARVVAGGGSADPETRVVARGGSDEKRRHQEQMFNLMMEELNAFDNPPSVDPHAVERFSLGIAPRPESESHTDNIVRLVESQTGDPDALLRTASTLVLAMKAMNARI